MLSYHAAEANLDTYPPSKKNSPKSGSCESVQKDAPELIGLHECERRLNFLEATFGGTSSMSILWNHSRESYVLCHS